MVTASACGGSEPAGPEPDSQSEEESFTVPAQGTAATFDLATWNIEWFGSTSNGPADEAGQLNRVRDIIASTDFDLWGVQEISVGSHFASLVGQLEGYSSVLANDPSVVGGSEFYSGFGNTELKVGLIFKTDLVEVLAAQIILTDFDHEFAGRPPLEVRIRVTIGGVATDATVIVLHAKANTLVESWERRSRGATALKEYLDETWAGHAVWVIGDWNDDIDESITAGRDTPYRLFVEAAPDWEYVTAPLTVAGVTSILGFDDVIDHQLASNEAMAWYQAGSAQVFRVDDLVTAFENTTSDHLPVLTRYVVTN